MHELNIGDIVRLKPGFEAFYHDDRLGEAAQGQIKDRKHDDGFPMVWIDWDTSPEGGWTFANHFEVVAKDASILATMPETEVTPQKRKLTDEQRADEYLQTALEGMDAVAEAEGFMTLVVCRAEKDGKAYLVPKIYARSLSTQATLAIEAQLIQIATELYQAALAAMNIEYGELD